MGDTGPLACEIRTLELEPGPNRAHLLVSIRALGFVNVFVFFASQYPYQ